MAINIVTILFVDTKDQEENQNSDHAMRLTQTNSNTLYGIVSIVATTILLTRSRINARQKDQAVSFGLAPAHLKNQI
jgi:hypothetical protein